MDSDIAREVAEALASVGVEMKGTPFTVLFTREARETPWDSTETSTWSVVAVDVGYKKAMDNMGPELMRTLLLEVGAYTPRIGDQVLLDGIPHTLRAFGSIAPAGNPVMHKVQVLA